MGDTPTTDDASRTRAVQPLECIVADPFHPAGIGHMSRPASFRLESGRSYVSVDMTHSGKGKESRFSDDLQKVADMLRDGRPRLDPLALDRVKLRAMSGACRSTSSRAKGFFMRTHLTTLLTIAFLSLGTAGALAVAGGADLGLGGHGGKSASFNQYRPPETPPVTAPPTKGPPATTPPVSTPPVPTPPASHFRPTAASARLSTSGAATVRCPAACHIVLRLRRGSHRVHVGLTLHARDTATLHLSKKQLARLGRGKAVVSVEVNGKVIATRSVSVG
jgi:hypothetical protein